jgi:D-aspartate ligase
MVQELIPGGDGELYTVGSYIAADGTVLGLFSGRKLRQTPPGVGTCRVGEAVWVDEVVDAALRLLTAFGFHGVSQVEFKRDPRDERFKLMEINPRLWQWHGLAAALGVDFARITYLDLVGRPPSRRTTEGRRGRWAITLMAKERPVLERPPYVEPVFSLADPKPGVAHLARIAKAVLR